MQELWQILITFLTEAGLKLVYAAAILILGLKLVNFFCNKLLKNKHLEGRDASLTSFLKSFLSVALKILVVITAALVIGIPAASFITILGSAGVAIGLALQGSLSNLAGGLVIMIFKLFRVGDYIETSAGNGTVKSINIFFTVLNTPDNRDITIPNSSLSNQSVVNCSVEGDRRSDITFDVSYSADIDAVKDAILAAAKADPRILPDPAPIVFMSAHKDSAVEYTLRFWSERKFFLPISMDIREAVKRAFDARGIEIPFNQLDVHIEK